MDITSLQNPRIKHIVKLRQDKRQRQRDGLMLVEGVEELTLALQAGLTPQTIFTAPELAARDIAFGQFERLTVSRGVFEKISFRENPDGWLGIFPIPRRTLKDLQLSENPFVIIAESIEKPGNLGAILRTADAAGLDAVIVCDPRLDVWSPNVVRASRGALFTVPAFEEENPQALEWVRSNHMRILAATPTAERDYTDVDMRRATAVIVGTEDTGLSEYWLTNSDEKVRIPMVGRINSLNVSIAAALMVYEGLRQRRPAGSDQPNFERKK